MEYRSRSVRLADNVWEALQKSEFSANQLLRTALKLDPITFPAEVDEQTAWEVPGVGKFPARMERRARGIRPKGDKTR